MVHATVPIALDTQILYSALLKVLYYIFGKTAFVYNLLAVILIYVQAILLNAIAVKHRLFNQSTYLVAFTYIVLTSLHPVLSHFNAQLLINFFLLFIVHELLQLKQSHSPNKQLFNIGFALSIASFFQFTVVFLIPFIFIALAILRPINIREYFVALIGLLMPLYILFVILFCIDQESLLHLWPNLGISLPSQLKPAAYYLTLFGGIFVLLVRSMYNMQTILPKTSIYIRRCWIMLTILLFTTIVVAVFTDKQIVAAWMVCLPVLALILAHTFVNERSKKMNIISFYFALAFVIFCQIFLPL